MLIMSNPFLMATMKNLILLSPGTLMVASLVLIFYFGLKTVAAKIAFLSAITLMGMGAGYLFQKRNKQKSGRLITSGNFDKIQKEYKTDRSYLTMTDEEFEASLEKDKEKALMINRIFKDKS